MNTKLETYQTLRATSRIIDREPLLDKIYAALRSDNHRTTLFYITAWGGWGKTRVVEEARHRAQGPVPGWDLPNVQTQWRMVDLYHSKVHSVDSLIQEVVTTLLPRDLQPVDEFVNYQKEWQTLLDMKFQRDPLPSALPKQRTCMEQAFIDDYNRLADEKARVLLVFDTAETIMYEPDDVQKALGAEPLGVGTWLVNSFLPNIQNTVVLLAGRPTSSKLLADLQHVSNIDFEHYELLSFEPQHTLDYFADVRHIAEQVNPVLARKIDRVTPDMRLAMHQLFNGHPLLISLLLDYLSLSDSLVDDVFMSPEEAGEILKDTAQTVAVRGRIMEAVLKRFVRLDRPLDDVIGVLAQFPKGADEELLAWINGEGKPSPEAISFQKETVIALLQKETETLSFIKIRADDQRVFLQDEMYSLFRRYRATSPSYKTYLFKITDDFYLNKIAEQRQQLIALEQEYNENTGARRQISTGLHDSVNQRMFAARTRLSELLVEQVYYHLRYDCQEGFALYQRYAEEAYLDNDESLWQELRDELLRYIESEEYKELPENDKFDKQGIDDIYSDLGIRWIKLSINQGDYQKALDQIERFRQKFPEWVERHDVGALDLRISESLALANLAREINTALQPVEAVLTALEEPDVIAALGISAVQKLKARALNIHGYVYRVFGSFGRAVESYRRALPLWRALKIKAEQANTLKDLAWMEAETGDFNAALDHCTDALNMYEALGKDYASAMALNTLGLIETRNDQPERAEVHITQALDICIRREKDRGIGLCYTALAEALRRMTNVPRRFMADEIVNHLDRAARYAQAAVEIFTDKVKEPLRLAEAAMELGLVYREWARYEDDVALRGEYAKNAEILLQKAVDHTPDSLIYRKADALVNLAYHYFYQSQYLEAEEKVREGRKYVPDTYLYTTKCLPEPGDYPITWLWVQLGKGTLLLGRIHYQRYLQAHTDNDNDRADAELARAAHDWALALAYDLHYAPTFRDLRRGMKLLTEDLSKLNPNELRIIWDSAHRTALEYHIEPEKRGLEKLMMDRLGYIPEQTSG